MCESADVKQDDAGPEYKGRFIQIRIEGDGDPGEPFDPVPYLKAYIQQKESGGGAVGMFFNGGVYAMLKVTASWSLVSRRRVIHNQSDIG